MDIEGPSNLLDWGSLSIGDDDHYVGLELLARRAWARFKAKTKQSEQRLPLEPIDYFKKAVLARLLDPERGLQPQLQAQLRTALNLPAYERRRDDNSAELFGSR